MQYLQITSDTTLIDLVDRVGATNVDNTLVLNGLTRETYIGQQVDNMIQDAYANASEVDWQRKAVILNRFVGDNDIFETVALLDESDWKVLSTYDIIPGYLQIPETVTLPDAEDVLGNGIAIGDTVYSDTMGYLYTEPHIIDPIVFNEYSVIKYAQVSDIVSTTEYNVMDQFNIPWGKITLFSDLSGDSIDFPVYPEEYEDGTSASYDTFSDLLYIYEPWQLYRSSGPRSIVLSFAFHRDMWTGDHRDGKANELIRFCESFCYPDFDGSAVYTDTCSLYINGSCYIHGIITEVKKTFSGPIGLDGFPLYCELDISFTEISQQALSRTTVRGKNLIA